MWHVKGFDGLDSLTSKLSMTSDDWIRSYKVINADTAFCSFVDVADEKVIRLRMLQQSNDFRHPVTNAVKPFCAYSVLIAFPCNYVDVTLKH